MTTIALAAAAAFLLWRAIVNGYRICSGTRYHDDYEWWFTWWPTFLSGPDEWDRCRAGRRSARLMWCRWVMRMRTKPGNYYVLPNWSDSRFTMLEKPWWMFWPKPIHPTWQRRACDKCGARSRHMVCDECPYPGPAPVGYDRQDGITIDQATAMEPR